MWYIIGNIIRSINISGYQGNIESSVQRSKMFTIILRPASYYWSHLRHVSLLQSKDPHPQLRCPHCKDKLRLWLGRGPDLVCSGECGGGGDRGGAGGGGGTTSDSQPEEEHIRSVALHWGSYYSFFFTTQCWIIMINILVFKRNTFWRYPKGKKSL